MSEQLDDIPARVIGCIVSTMHLEPEKVTADSSFEALGIDSLDGINILFALENEFDLSIPDDAARQVRTVTDLIAGIRTLLAQKASAA
jgi:acyl carrier protein